MYLLKINSRWHLSLVFLLCGILWPGSAPITKDIHTLHCVRQRRRGLDSGVGANQDLGLLWNTSTSLSHRPAEGRRFEIQIITGGF